MGGSSFSLWQPWFMAALGLAAVFAGLGRNIVAAQRRDCAATDADYLNREESENEDALMTGGASAI